MVDIGKVAIGSGSLRIEQTNPMATDEARPFVPEPGPSESRASDGDTPPDAGGRAGRSSATSRRWLVPLVAVLVVAAGVGGYWYVSHGSQTPTTTIGVPPSGPALVDISAFHFTGQNVNVSVEGASSFGNLSAGGEVNLSLVLDRHCSEFGCSAEVEAISVASPFGLLGTSPALPYNWTSSLPVTLLLHLAVPSTPGDYAVNGTVTGTPPPGGVAVNGVSFLTSYVGVDSGYLSVLSPDVPLKVPENTSFPITLQLESSSWYTEELAGLSLAVPFQLVSIAVSFPVRLDPNATLDVPLTVRAPTAGNYTLTGTVTTDPTPVITLGNVSWSLAYHVDPFYSVAPVLSAPPSVIRVGQTFTLDAWIYNNDTTSHIYQFTGLNSNWTAVSVSPTTLRVVDQAGSYVEWILWIQAPATAGFYNLVVDFADWS